MIERASHSSGYAVVLEHEYPTGTRYQPVIVVQFTGLPRGPLFERLQDAQRAAKVMALEQGIDLDRTGHWEPREGDGVKGRS